MQADSRKHLIHWVDLNCALANAYQREGAVFSFEFWMRVLQRRGLVARAP